MTSIQNTPPAKGAGARKRKSKKLSSSENVLAITGGSEIAATLLGDKITDSANGSQTGREKAEKEYIKDVSKRLRRQSKKMDNIRKSEDKIKDLSEEDQATTKLINSDERSKIGTKPITSAVYKELNEIHDILKKVADAEDKRIDAEKAEGEAKFSNAVAEAKEEGRKAGVEEATAKIFTMVRFLRLAGYRRQYKSPNDQEDDAIEKLLVLVYGGDQTAVDACLKLANGSEEPIDEFEVTYSQIKEVAHALKLPGEEDQSEEPETETVELEAVESTATDTELVVQEEGVDEPPAYTALDDTAEEGVLPPQPLTNGDVEVPEPVPAAVATDEAATEGVETIGPVETAPEVAVEAQNTSDEAPVESAPATDALGASADSWADDEVKIPDTAVPAIPENKEGEFQNVERRGGYRGRGGHRGPRGEGYRGGYRGRGARGEYRGRGRGDGEYRGRGDGEYRGRGDGEYRGRGDGEYRGRGDGEYRGRGDGEYRGRGDGEYRGRGDGEYRGRGDGEYRGRGDGEYRGRGGYRRERGDGENRGGYRGRGRGEHHHQGPRPQHHQQQQQPQESQEPQSQAPQEPAPQEVQEVEEAAPAQPDTVST